MQERGSADNGQVGSVDPRKLEDAARRLTSARRHLGIAQADADWVEQPFEDWLGCLGSTGTMLGQESVIRFASGMLHSLAIRDALIISVVARSNGDGTSPCSTALLVGFASRPHDPMNVERMGDLLAEAFEDKEARADALRCGNALAILASMVEILPDEYTVQPLAIMAYIAWWMGSDEASVLAFRALDRDEGCTLAAIVCSALRHGIWPAWLNCSSDMRG